MKQGSVASAGLAGLPAPKVSSLQALGMAQARLGSICTRLSVVYLQVVHPHIPRRQRHPRPARVLQRSAAQRGGGVGSGGSSG